MVDQRFDRLTVIRRIDNDKYGRARWLCKCDCGGQNEVGGFSLRAGNVRSCGCLAIEARSATGRVTGPENLPESMTHGHTINGYSPTYQSWSHMKWRCLNPKADNYKYYGGVGIIICDRWLNSFENFLADMGQRPDGLSLDRYPDPYGNYDASNCRWATRKQQQANKRSKVAL